MELTTCKNCGARVVLLPDGNCPRCREAIANDASKFADNPFASPIQNDAAAAKNDGMTIGEKVYSAVVILCVGFFLLSLASFHFIIIPGARDPGVFYFIVSILWMYVLALLATVATNIYHRALLTIPTTIQCAILGLSFYLIPFAIWGGILLYLRLQRAKIAR
jgi:hypothetical protein